MEFFAKSQGRNINQIYPILRIYFKKMVRKSNPFLSRISQKLNSNLKFQKSGSPSLLRKCRGHKR